MAKDSKSSSNKGSSKSSSSGSKSSTTLSDYAFVRQAGYENERHFMHSYGLKEPGGYAEAKVILDGMRESSGAGVSPYREGGSKK